MALTSIPTLPLSALLAVPVFHGCAMRRLGGSYHHPRDMDGNRGQRGWACRRNTTLLRAAGLWYNHTQLYDAVALLATEILQTNNATTQGELSYAMWYLTCKYGTPAVPVRPK